ARDNGAIMRLPHDGGRVYKWDNVWTFGTKSTENGYMIFTGNVRVHQVVCTAFHGPPPEPNMVVDHIDTNRCNNRPENLRWCTRLENALNNPITRRKIELICGSMEAFVANPALLREHEGKDPNFAWMRAVTPAEAKASYNNWMSWAKMRDERKDRKGGKGVGEWIFDDQTVAEAAKWTGGMGTFYERHKPWAQRKLEIEEETRQILEARKSLKESLTPSAKQLNWVTPTEFLMCPQAVSMPSYLSNIKVGEPFSCNQYGGGGRVLDFGYNQQDDAIYVLSDLGPGATKQWALCKITVEDGYFVHENRGSFFEEDGGRKYFTLAMGEEWAGGDVFDDFC
ncbi:MAG: HNH endonuclease, partial [Bacteroidales bacterium]|nr:HNH endonuclease [Bacteroidales bacterium]